MKVCLNIILTITICLFSFSYLYANDNASIKNSEEMADNESAAGSEEVPTHNSVKITDGSIDNANAVYYSAGNNYYQEIKKRYM